LNLIEAWWERPVDSDELVFRNSIPPDASSATINWDRFVANTTRRPFDAQRFFWWPNYWYYGTGIPGDLFVHLFSGEHFVLDSEGPARTMATGAGRLCGGSAPLRLSSWACAKNFARGSEETSGFRFVGEKGILHIGGDGVRPGTTVLRSQATISRRSGIPA
jgi:predicted dehydrogenase